MKILMIAFPILVGLIAALASMGLGGMFISKSHIGTRAARFDRPPEQVWSVITDFQGATSWRKGLKSVERLPDQNGHTVWRETSSHGVIPIEVVELTPPRKMVCRIADPKLPFGGTWTYELAPEGSGTRLRITENGEIYNAMFRYISKLMGYTGTIEGYLKGLATKLGSPAIIEP